MNAESKAADVAHPGRGELRRGLSERAGRLRPVDVVMKPEMLGAARLTRYSFSRTMLRRAAAGWTVDRSRFDMDPDGRGEAVYVVNTGRRTFSFVAFTDTIDESEHTDRVIANNWEITGALVDGEVSPQQLVELWAEVRRQEDGRFGPRVLVLTRGNRSVRFFQYLVDRLAAGHQPEADRVADAGYIMRSTAFYANGKYGMRSFEGYPDGHELAVPYRAQFVAAWLFRELSYDVVEHCAVAKGGANAVGFDQDWARYFGLGNATGLGLVPYAIKHPGVINAWVGIREMALADVRALEATPDRRAELVEWIGRARNHFRSGTTDDCHPFLNGKALLPIIEQIADRLDSFAGRPDAFDALYRWADTQDPETAELTVSLLVELHRGDDDLIDRLLTVAEHQPLDPMITVSEVLAHMAARFAWIDQLDLDGPSADHFWWVISDNTEEPRRVKRSRLEPNDRDMAIDVACRVNDLRNTLAGYSADTSISTVLAEHPTLRLAAERVCHDPGPYGEPQDNTCSPAFLPLQLQRFQLAMYGMDNFKPKSTDWLRATLFQGAPRRHDITSAADDWVLPARPRSA